MAELQNSTAEIKAELTNNTATLNSSIQIAAKGDKGDKGDPGPQGPQGLKGDKGDKGEQGEIGSRAIFKIGTVTTGDQVAVTNSGTDEDPVLDIVLPTPGKIINIKGDTGATGPTGPQGPKGDKGDTGAAGPQGAKGDKGDTGATGPQGLQGIQGIQGPQGAQGDKGDTGPQGPQGLQGIQGDKGDKGDKGDQGEQGVLGVKTESHIITAAAWTADATYGDGYTASIDFSKVLPDTATCVVSAGRNPALYKCNVLGITSSNATVSTLHIYVKNKPGADITVDIVIMQSVLPGSSDGEPTIITGPQGPKGDKGDTGATGPQGVRGLQGPKGDKGDTGAIGPQGSTGPAGTNGIDGKDGKNASILSSQITIKTTDWNSNVYSTGIAAADNAIVYIGPCTATTSDMFDQLAMAKIITTVNSSVITLTCAGIAPTIDVVISVNKMEVKA